jgi:hypothetical protein
MRVRTRCAERRGGEGAPFLALGAVASALAGAGRAGACEPVRVPTTAESVPEAWRPALAAMIEATRREGTPWSCSAGVLVLTVDPSGQGRLRLDEPGHEPAERRVAVPDHLVPMAEALLAVPAPPAAPPIAPPPAPVAVKPPEAVTPPKAAPPIAPPTASAPTVPRLLIDTLFVFRYATPSPGAWVGGDLRASLPFGEWSLGLGARYDLLLAYAHDQGSRDSMSEVVLGAAVGRRLLRAPVEVVATFEPRLAVVVFEAQTTTDRTAGSHADWRLAAGLRAAHRITDSARWVVALDTEVTPMALGGEHHAGDMTHALPAFGLGLAVGLEAAVQ